MHPIIYLSTAFDGQVAEFSPQTAHLYIGEKGLLRLLEQQLGFAGYPEKTDYFRIEMYRQALTQFANAHADVFYKKSLEADRFATATALLGKRDGLLLAGFFNGAGEAQSKADAMPRIAVLAEVELLFQKKINSVENIGIAKGFADRFVQVLEAIQQNQIVHLGQIRLYDPTDLLPIHLQRLLTVLQKKGVPIDYLNEEQDTTTINNGSDLDHLRQSLWSEDRPVKKQAELDGSLVIVKAKSDVDLAVFIAQLLSQNADYQPLVLAPESNRTLEQAIASEGLPIPGVLSASLARPSLQVLKLAPAFLWRPFDVHKVMEFVTLPLKPIDDGLATEVARVMAEKPGIRSDLWFARVFTYMDTHEQSEEIRKQYDFWFDRRRFDVQEKAPKGDALSIFGALYDWALELMEKGQSKHVGLPMLVEQARRIMQLLRALPEETIGFLELERIIRTVYEAAPMQENTEKGALTVIHHEGALSEQVDDLLWWNCIYNESAPRPDDWLPEERQWLRAQQAEPDSPEKIASLRRYHRNKPIRMVRGRAVLVVPDRSEGAETQPPLIMGDIEAAFDKVENLICNIDTEAGREKIRSFWALHNRVGIEGRTLRPPNPLLQIPQPELVKASEYETYTNLDDLFHYPHKWFLKNKAQLRSMNLLTVKELRTLQGTLAHRFFEDILMHEEFVNWGKSEIHDWIEERAPILLEREGAVLLLYGLEPERQRLISRVKQSAWNLNQILRRNEWKIVATELNLEGTFGGLPIKGKADLVLERGDEAAILDLKWSGANYRLGVIQSEKDLQLTLYSYLLQPTERWAHTAYFIMEEGRLLARDRKAFDEAETPAECVETYDLVQQKIFQKMERTFDWRLKQIQSGYVELRSERTHVQLDQFYMDLGIQLNEYLDLPTEDAKWDDFGLLVSLG